MLRVGFGNAGKRMGNMVPLVREKIFLVSKTEAPDYDGTRRLLERSLKRLNTDSIDLIHMHNFFDQRRCKDLNDVFSEKGLTEAQSEKWGPIHGKPVI
jgi:uncharacterized protein